MLINMGIKYSGTFRRSDYAASFYVEPDTFNLAYRVQKEGWIRERLNASLELIVNNGKLLDEDTSAPKYSYAIPKSWREGEKKQELIRGIYEYIHLVVEHVSDKMTIASTENQQSLETDREAELGNNNSNSNSLKKYMDEFTDNFISNVQIATGIAEINFGGYEDYLFTKGIICKPTQPSTSAIPISGHTPNIVYPSSDSIRKGNITFENGIVSYKSKDRIDNSKVDTFVKTFFEALSGLFNLPFEIDEKTDREQGIRYIISPVGHEDYSEKFRVFVEEDNKKISIVLGVGFGLDEKKLEAICNSLTNNFPIFQSE